LITGVVISLLLEVAGMLLFYRENGHLLTSQDPSVFIQGSNFFTFVYDHFRGIHIGGDGVLLMTLGLVILMLTPFVRVLMSVFYFAFEKNFRYMWITMFVLVVLTMSLLFH